MKLCLSESASEPSHSPLQGPMLVCTCPALHISLGVENCRDHRISSGRSKFPISTGHNPIAVVSTARSDGTNRSPTKYWHATVANRSPPEDRPRLQQTAPWRLALAGAPLGYSSTTTSTHWSQFQWTELPVDCHTKPCISIGKDAQPHSPLRKKETAGENSIDPSNRSLVSFRCSGTSFPSAAMLKLYQHR